MKSCCSSRLGSSTSASAISFKDETKMWLTRVLGEDTPDCLRDTVMFLLGMSCALHGREEHHHLCCPPFNPQITVKTDLGLSIFSVHRG